MAERRTISADEIEIVRWPLANGALKDVADYNAESLDGCEVVSACPCGCATSTSCTPRNEDGRPELEVDHHGSSPALAYPLPSGKT